MSKEKSPYEKRRIIKETYYTTDEARCLFLMQQSRDAVAGQILSKKNVFVCQKRSLPIKRDV